ncbi:zinc finger BED domain-containing protein 5-like [Homarus americanus]|uniref:zinc finger BED domain-containing protein 5-like n=1 Tax=Homarus americanus TaxID=6706 RepID=UPI001C470B9F|nr:zinc finger BED domain-containing protein 5-like [Homarus americanus]
MKLQTQKFHYVMSKCFQSLGSLQKHEALLFYSKVCLLSRGNVVNRVFELQGELKLFLEVQGKDDLLSHFSEVLWEPRLAYLAYIFEQLNRLNLKLQGKDRNVFHLTDCLRTFLAKLQNWQMKVSAGNVAMFENLSTVLDEIEDHLLDPSLKTEITQHLKSLESELKKYFSEFEEEDGKLVRNHFSGTLDIATISNDVQDEFLDLKNDSAAKDLYEERSLTVFWCSMYQSYQKVSAIALRVLLPFSTTYLCESGFSTLLHIKNKSRNQLDVDPDMRCVLSVTQSRISHLTERKQCQPSQ